MTKLLVIDDDRPICNLTRLKLEAQGYQVHTACTGEQGWDEIVRWHPDLVVTDLNMPELYGLDLLKRIRSMPETRALPVLCMSVDNSSDVKREAISLGATGWIQKPIHPNTWGKTLERILH